MRDELVAYTDERGRVLWDLPDAPRPDPDTPAPVRFLPAFDNALLGYDDRTRIVDDAHRGLSVAGTRVVLVDGRVSATWKVEADTVVGHPAATADPHGAFRGRRRGSRDGVVPVGRGHRPGHGRLTSRVATRAGG